LLLDRNRAAAGFDVLKANTPVHATKLAVIGYCFGGTVPVELAETGVPIVGMISVHGSPRNFMPEAAKNIKGRVLILHGAEDPVAPLTEVNAVVGQLRAAKVDFEQQLFSAHRTPSPIRKTPPKNAPTANTRSPRRGS
jgi:dienelactone hydrolase